MYKTNFSNINLRYNLIDLKSYRHLQVGSYYLQKLKNNFYVKALSVLSMFQIDTIIVSIN